jgi:dUTP pyrophosphatase
MACGPDPLVPVRVEVMVLPHGRGLPLPAPATGHAAGLDLAAALESELTLMPGARALVPTGIALAIPPGHEGQVRPRSGLASKHGIVVPNSPGTIDADYRGEVLVLLMNAGNEPFTVRRGMRIAQLVVAPVSAVALEAVAELPPTSRGDGGFGHTGA